MNNLRKLTEFNRNKTLNKNTHTKVKKLKL